MNWIIAYDITDKRRLQKIHRQLTDIAISLQNSTFLYQGNQTQLIETLEQLMQNLDPKKDDLRAYPLAGKLYRLGKPSLGTGISLGNFPETPSPYLKHKI